MTEKIDSSFRGETAHASLGSEFYDPVMAARFPRHILRFRNDAWAERIGLARLGEAKWIDHFARFEPLPGSFREPLALRYHGHQFRVYNPDLGDGRGFLFAQVRDLVDGRLLDLGTKGSGQTPYSRSADGRLTLKGGVREILAAEMLEASGVYTSKTFSLVETGEALQRSDEPSPTRSAVLVRLSHSHIRIGSFQRLAVREEHDAMRRLVDHVIEHHWPEAGKAADPVAALYECITDATSRLVAEWFAAGFVHGVLNTDNINVTGESFDYGPWRFLETFDPRFTAAYFDQFGLYSFARQPEAIHWNLARFGECLIPLSDQARIEPIFDGFTARFQKALARQTLARLGLAMPDDTDRAIGIVHDFYGTLYMSKAPFERTFFDLLGGGIRERLEASPERARYETPDWAGMIGTLQSLDPAPGLEPALAHPYAAGDAPETMLIDEVEAIWSAIDRDDDWRPLEEKIARIRARRAFSTTLGLLRSPNARPNHVPLAD